MSTFDCKDRWWRNRFDTLNVGIVIVVLDMLDWIRKDRLIP